MRARPSTMTTSAAPGVRRQDALTFEFVTEEALSPVALARKDRGEARLNEVRGAAEVAGC